MPTGFDYPEFSHRRRHGPQGYASYESYRPWLRDEFTFRCVYCLVREQWGRTAGEFDLDHYYPQTLRPHQAADYDNLVYSCAACNSTKGDQLVPNPTFVLTRQQVIVHHDGGMDGLTEDADRLIRMLDLDSDEYRLWRQTWIRVLELAHEYAPSVYRRLMGFPESLPDLARLRPPGGNTRADGIEDSYFEQRRRGTLAEMY